MDRVKIFVVVGQHFTDLLNAVASAIQQDHVDRITRLAALQDVVDKRLVTLGRSIDEHQLASNTLI